MFLAQFKRRFSLAQVRKKLATFVVLAKQVITDFKCANRIQIESACVEFLQIR